MDYLSIQPNSSHDTSMELIRGLHNLRPRHKGCVATIGAFDGIHHGHRAVLEQLATHAKELNVPSVVIVLEPLPREYFAPVTSPARLTNFRERYVQLQTCNIDRVLRIRFDKALSQVSAEDFIRNVFVDGLGIRHMVVGDDIRFGHERKGDFDLLKAQGERYNFGVTETQTLAIDGERVSSTRIRKALMNDNFELATRLLGREYAIAGKVAIGQQLGRTLGFPTANVQLRRFRAALSGVYAVEVEGVDGSPLQGVANIGTRPTVNDSITARLEVHLLDFNRDIYDQHISVVFKKKIREEKKFSSIDELKQNIQRDVQTARDYFANS